MIDDDDDDDDDDDGDFPARHAKKNVTRFYPTCAPFRPTFLTM